VDNAAKVHNDPSVTRVGYEDAAHEVALTGIYRVNGMDCRPAFDLLKEHVKKYTPEYVEKITSVPAARMLFEETSTSLKNAQVPIPDKPGRNKHATVKK